MQPEKLFSIMPMYQAALGACTAAFTVALIATGHGVGDPWAVGGLAAAAALAERGRVRLQAHTEASISLLPTVFAAALFGPLAALLVGAASLLADFPPLLRGEKRAAVLERGQPYLRWGIYTCTRATTGAVAGIAASSVLPFLQSVAGGLALATVVAALVAEPVDVALVTLTGYLRGIEARDMIGALAPVSLASIPLYTPVVAVLGIAYRELSPWTLPLFFVPALAAQRLFTLYQQQRTLAEDFAVVNERLQAANLSFATALVATLDARDRYTAGHSAAVAVYARDIAARLGMDSEGTSRAHLAGLVHDIGKIGLPAGLLEKPGALTLEERRQMEQHPVIGERILANVQTYAEVASAVRHHHERVDGHGYPDGLTDDSIPLLARIIAVADAYDAMTSDRPYRDAMPSRVARLRLAQAVGSQFDTSVVAAFEAILAASSDEYRDGNGAEFRLSTPAGVAPEAGTAEVRAVGGGR